ncbi:2-oxoglutarate-dependent dioxygenase htyE [Holothuria leucospilota]|uniref:2-oxoglutarate-dependent dioxygenase htyE n=1 Tax=Holothuria leucospilota TaxID=206669 RepID=A0A9Q1BRW5_HOLLE|nr:2-oxoglutarate-dependent dioxygenase htyE [Holothuria leucospilota]
MEVSTIDSIPVVDFEAYRLEKECPDSEKLQKLVDEIHHAFTTIGFVYLKNTGFPAYVIQDAFEKSKVFFTLEAKEKVKHLRGHIIPGSNFGYVQTEQEGLNPERTHMDLKEFYNFLPDRVEEVMSELKETPPASDLIEALHIFFDHGKTLHHRVLEIMARGLKLDDPYLFTKKHQYFGMKAGIGTVRTTYYPPVKSAKAEGDQVRCGEHSDYGGITLLVQDSPGLEVCNVKGQWIQAPPIEGTILVNIGDLMQRWTSDKFIACKHRVLLPVSEEDRASSRQSITLFGHPDRDEIIECVDGSQKYPPVGSREYLDMRFSATYSREVQK